MRALLVLLPLATVAASPTPHSDQATDACLAEFKLCAAHCTAADSGVPHERSCRTGCARTSALCQAAIAVPLGAAKPAVNATASSDFAFTDANGERFLPFGFYQYTVTKDLDKRLPGEEAMHGMTLTSPYASTSEPDAEWYSAMDAFLDSCVAAGFRVNFQLIAFESKPNDAGTLANLTAQINRYKSHPAVMAWYLADEPGGSGIKNSTLLPKYKAIRAADETGKPVSMVFCTTQAADYLEMLDVIMVDPYPVPSSSAATVQGALSNVASLGKPVMLVPQAFGGGENWARSPSRQEERLMTYLGLLSGAKAIQYFVRNPEGQFPYAPAAWSEIRIIANEVRVLTPALLGGKPVPASVSTPPAKASVDAAECAQVTTVATAAAAATVVKAWVDRDGTVVVVAANTVNADGPTANVVFKVNAPLNADESSQKRASCKSVRVMSMFENRFVKFAAPVKQDGTVSFEDSLRGFATAAYRLECNTPLVADVDITVGAIATIPDSAPAAGLNTVYNPSYEITVNPAVPDGNYVTQPADQYGGGFFFAEYRDSKTGRASLRLTAPVAAGGVTLSPYTVPRVAPSHGYTFSVWAKGSGTISFALNKAIFPAQGSAVMVNASAEWVQTTVKLTSTSDPTSACQYGCRSWLEYGLSTNGDVLLDELSLVKD